MVDWTSGLADASVAERDSGFVIVRIPGTTDVLKEAAISGFVTKDAGGKVGIGTSSPSAKLQVSGAVPNSPTTFNVNHGASGNLFDYASSTVSAVGGIKGGVTAWSIGSARAGTLAVGTESNHPMMFTTNDIERGRIDSGGQFRWGSSATIDTVSFLPFQVTSGIAIDTNTTAGAAAMSFFNGQGPNTRVGWIGTLGSSTSYNTSSDRTLKKNIADAQDPESIILSILIRQFDWKVNDEHQRYGAIAQELLDVYPEAVSSGPDGILGVDFSKFIPMMLKHIQLLTARVALLEGAKS
jgi:hypothetical protein